MLYIVAFEEIKKHIPLMKNNDVFKNELTIFSEHIYGYSIHEDIPIDVIYKSNPSGERIFIVFDSCFGLRVYNTSNIILNIDGKRNIEIEKTYADKDDEQFEITKDQLYELCLASSLKVQINGSDGVKWEGDANAFITVLQALYNEAFDNSMFNDAKNILMSYACAKMEDDKKKAKEDEIKSRIRERRERLIVIIVTLIPVMCLLFLLFVGDKTVFAIALGISSLVALIYFAWKYAH